MLKKMDFILELDKLKAILRKSKPLGLDRYENSAEHSWHVCMLAMVLTEDASPEVDSFKVIKMLLLHDIVEIDAGDVLVYDTKKRAEAYEKELHAAKRIFGLLPKHLNEEFLDIWIEFEKGISRESLFAQAIDRVIPVLQNINNNGQSWQENNISLKQVLEKNSVIAHANPLLWEHIKEKLENSPFWEK